MANDEPEAIGILESFHFHLDRMATALASLAMEPPPDSSTTVMIDAAERELRELSRSINAAKQYWRHAHRAKERTLRQRTFVGDCATRRELPAPVGTDSGLGGGGGTS